MSTPTASTVAATPLKRKASESVDSISSDEDSTNPLQNRQALISLIEVDSKGDLIIVTGEETPQAFLVSRKAFCLGSPVFAAMLGDDSPFFESSDQAIGIDGRRRITLPDDSSRTFEIIARIVHLQNDVVSSSISFTRLVSLAILCDKYDLRRCLGLWPQKWQAQHLDHVESRGYERWIFVALVFRNAAVFSQISKYLILNTSMTQTGNLAIAGSCLWYEGIPPGILNQIEESRATTAAAIKGFCHDILLDLIHSDSNRVCRLTEFQHQCDAMNLGSLLLQFPELCGPAERYAGTVAELVNRIDNIAAHGNHLKFFQQGVSHNTASHVTCSLRGSLKPQVQEILDKVKGLTLPKV